MKKTTIIEGRLCLKCSSVENQANFGYNRSGTQRCKCKDCNITYTLEPKNRAYDEEMRNSAIKAYYSGVSGRGVGKLFKMSKANVYNWLKKTGRIVD